MDLEDVYRSHLGGWEDRQDLLERALEKGATADRLGAAEAKGLGLDVYVSALEENASDAEIFEAVDAGILPWLYPRALRTKATHAQIMQAFHLGIAQDPGFAWGIGGTGYIDLLGLGATHEQLLATHERGIHPSTIRLELENGKRIDKMLEAHDQGVVDSDLYTYAEAARRGVAPEDVLKAHRAGLRGLVLHLYLELRERGQSHEFALVDAYLSILIARL